MCFPEFPRWWNCSMGSQHLFAHNLHALYCVLFKFFYGLHWCCRPNSMADSALLPSSYIMLHDWFPLKLIVQLSHLVWSERWEIPGVVVRDTWTWFLWRAAVHKSWAQHAHGWGCEATHKAMSHTCVFTAYWACMGVQKKPLIVIVYLCRLPEGFIVTKTFLSLWFSFVVIWVFWRIVPSLNFSLNAFLLGLDMMLLKHPSKAEKRDSISVNFLRTWKAVN